MRKLIFGLMLILVLVGNFASSTPQLAVAQTRWCENCANTCWSEANNGENNKAFWRCRDSGGSVEYCDKTITESYYNGCVSTTCNYGGGCTIPLIY